MNPKNPIPNSLTRRRFLGAAGATLAASTLARRSSVAQGAPARRVNVLLITADDIGWQLGCYGDPLARTPRLDALAAEGVQFLNGYVTQASCSPSRSSMLTGLYPHQNGHLGLANHGYEMHPGIATLPALLKDVGYKTGILGKLHVNPGGAFPFDFSDTDGKKTLDVKTFADTAEGFMRGAGEQPFLLYANFLDPHKPFQDQVEGVPAQPQTPEQMRPFPFHPDVTLTDRVRDDMAGFYNGVARLDTGVGLLLDALKKSGHADDTLVIFVGDHGAPFPRAKNAVYEAGVKVPFIVRWPGQSRPHRDARLVSTIDFVPTICQLAGAKTPAGLPGASLRPLMSGETVPWRVELGAEYNTHGRGGWFPQRSLRDGRFKLIHTFLPGQKNPKPAGDGGARWLEMIAQVPADGPHADVWARNERPPEWQLFDLQNDEWEFYNLAGKPEYATVESSLRKRLAAWQEATDDPIRDPAQLAEMTQLHGPNGPKPKKGEDAD